MGRKTLYCQAHCSCCSGEAKRPRARHMLGLHQPYVHPPAPAAAALLELHHRARGLQGPGPSCPAQQLPGHCLLRVKPRVTSEIVTSKILC